MKIPITLASWLGVPQKSSAPAQKAEAGPSGANTRRLTELLAANSSLCFEGRYSDTSDTVSQVGQSSAY